MRFRNLFIGFGSLLVLIILVLSEPSSGIIQNLPIGSGTLSVLIVLMTAVLYVGLLHISRRALFDYLKLDEFFKEAIKTSEGSGLALIAVSLAMISISLVIAAAVK